MNIWSRFCHFILSSPSSRWTAVGPRLRSGSPWVRVSLCQGHWSSGSWWPAPPGTPPLAVAATTAETAACSASQSASATAAASWCTCCSPLRLVWATVQRVGGPRELLFFFSQMGFSFSSSQRDLMQCKKLIWSKVCKICHDFYFYIDKPFALNTHRAHCQAGFKVFSKLDI